MQGNLFFIQSLTILSLGSKNWKNTCFLTATNFQDNFVLKSCVTRQETPGTFQYTHGVLYSIILVQPSSDSYRKAFQTNSIVPLCVKPRTCFTDSLFLQNLLKLWQFFGKYQMEFFFVTGNRNSVHDGIEARILLGFTERRDLHICSEYGHVALSFSIENQ